VLACQNHGGQGSVRTAQLAAPNANPHSPLTRTVALNERRDYIDPVSGLELRPPHTGRALRRASPSLAIPDVAVHLV
jgi:hypothetical protein